MIALCGAAALAAPVEAPEQESSPAPVSVESAPAALEIVVEGLRSSADPTRHVADGEIAWETPGTLEDPVRLVQAMPGAAVQRELGPNAGTLSIRGSAPDDSRIYIDGIEVPYLYHFNQYASVFPAGQVGMLEMYPSTFSARYGDAVGAIVEIQPKLERPDAVHGTAQVSSVMAGGEVAVPAGRAWWVSGSARRSYQDLVQESSDQYTVWPIFGDFAVRAERGDADGGGGVFAMGATDRWSRAVGEIEEQDPYEASVAPVLDHQQGFALLGGRRQWQGGPVAGRVVGGLVVSRRRSDLAEEGAEDLESWALASRLDLGWRWSDLPGWDLGAEVVGSHTSLFVDPAGYDGVRVAEEAPSLARGVAIDAALPRVKGGLYGTLHLPLAALRVMPGVRLSADSTVAELQVDPRLTMRLTIGEQTMFKAGAGRYSQRPETEDLLSVESLPTTRSWQVTAGWEQTVAGRWEIGADGWWKTLTDPLVEPIDAPPYAVPRGDGWGVELVSRYRLRERFFTWGWVSVSQVRLEEADGTVVPADGDQRVAAGVVASYDIHHTQLAARYRYGSGLPYTPIADSLYDFGNDAWVPTPGETNAARMPPYHKVELRVAQTFPFRGWSLEVYGEVWMVPASSAALYPIWNYDYSVQGYVIGPTVVPLLGARATF